MVNQHPMMFRDCTIGVINQIDLAPLVGANLDRMEFGYPTVSSHDARIQEQI